MCQPVYFRLRSSLRLNAIMGVPWAFWVQARPADGEAPIKVPVDRRIGGWFWRDEDGKTSEHDLLVLLRGDIRENLGKSFVLSKAGAYGVRLQIGGDEGMTSNTVEVAVSALPHGQRQALSVYQKKEVIALGLTGKPYGDAIEHASTLARRFPDCAYSSWVLGPLTVARFKAEFEKHNIGGGAMVYGPLCVSLGKCVTRPERSAVNEQAYFYLAYAQALSGRYEAGRDTLSALRRKYPNGFFRRRAAKLLGEVADKLGRRRP